MTKSPPELYFAFPDGVLHYVCAECTALCCKGHGFGGSLERHMRSLFVLYPALESTVISRKADIVELSTPPTGCHFLEPDNHCGIETRHGKSAKPGDLFALPVQHAPAHRIHHRRRTEFPLSAARRRSGQAR